MHDIPNLESFDPRVIPYQYDVLKLLNNFDYSRGTLEVMLSGSVGSAKSILMAHAGIVHCLTHPRAQICLGRRSMPDLKETILSEVVQHLEGSLVEGKDFEHNLTSGTVLFRNGSSFICRSWADRKYKKARSLKLSGLIIEELTENTSEEFNNFYKEYAARVGRRPWIKQNFILCATNPDTPAHAAHEYFIDKGVQHKKEGLVKGSNESRHVFYSVTSDNPFLPPEYTTTLKTLYTERECRRMIYGEWIDIRTDVIYYAFDETKSIIGTYQVNPNYPIGLTFDFNIALDKPMSCALFQYIDKKFYFFDEVVMQSSRTDDVMDELENRGLLNYDCLYEVFGDASGKHSDTRSKISDYDIIKNRLNRLNKRFVYRVPLANPPVRSRHTLVNGQLCNALGETSVLVTKNCKTLIKGLKLTKLKSGGNYIEDDSDDFQHITTAMGYAIIMITKAIKRKSSTCVEL